MSDTMNVNETERAWIKAFCRTCVFAIQVRARLPKTGDGYYDFPGAPAQFSCRHSPPSRMSGGEGAYPVVSDYTPACAQYQEDV